MKKKPVDRDHRVIFRNTARKEYGGVKAGEFTALPRHWRTLPAALSGYSALTVTADYFNSFSISNDPIDVTGKKVCYNILMVPGSGAWDSAGTVCRY
jgi:hypothetical protein